jgi:hypothetical protein
VRDEDTSLLMNRVEIETENGHQNLLVDRRPRCQSLPLIRPDTIIGTFIRVGDKKPEVLASSSRLFWTVEPLLRITTEIPSRSSQQLPHGRQRIMDSGSTIGQFTSCSRRRHRLVISPLRACRLPRAFSCHASDSPADMSGITSNGD